MVQTDSVNNKICVITGATASGKSDLSVAVAKVINAEIISADAFQIYRGLDIGTAKIDIAACPVRHHLIDIVEPDRTFSVSDYIKLADEAIADIVSRGKRVIVCGGTGFYIKGLLFKQSLGRGGRNVELRAELEEKANSGGLQALHSMLENVDPASAAKIHFNDKKRVIRALEIFYSVGIKKSDTVDGDTLEQRYPHKIFQINVERDLLYERINKRTDAMLACGLAEEVFRLKEFKDCQSMSAIGYKELIRHFEGELTLLDAADKIRQATRNYAKRQLTFFKGFKDVVMLDCSAGIAQNTDKIFGELF